MTKQAIYQSASLTHRGVATNSSGQRWNGTTWESHTDGNWSTYLITPTRLGTSNDIVFAIPEATVLLGIYNSATPVVTDAADAELRYTGTAPISADAVHSNRTHFIGSQGYRASNIITVYQGFVGTFAMMPALNDSTDILTVDSVTITGAATVTATALTTSADRKKANYTVPALSVVGSYDVVVTVTTTDGQTLPHTGTIKVE